MVLGSRGVTAVLLLPVGSVAQCCTCIFMPRLISGVLCAGVISIVCAACGFAAAVAGAAPGVAPSSLVAAAAFSLVAAAGFSAATAVGAIVSAAVIKSSTKSSTTRISRRFVFMMLLSKGQL